MPISDEILWAACPDVANTSFLNELVECHEIVTCQLLYFCSSFGLFPSTNMAPIKVLFVCVHNSARSQMAEAYLNHFGEGRFEAESAGLEPGTLNPRVVHVM